MFTFLYQYPALEQWLPKGRDVFEDLCIGRPVTFGLLIPCGPWEHAYSTHSAQKLFVMGLQFKVNRGSRVFICCIWQLCPKRATALVPAACGAPRTCSSVPGMNAASFQNSVLQLPVVKATGSERGAGTWPVRGPALLLVLLSLNELFSWSCFKLSPFLCQLVESSGLHVILSYQHPDTPDSFKIFS